MQTKTESNTLLTWLSCNPSAAEQRPRSLALRSPRRAPIAEDEPPARGGRGCGSSGPAHACAGRTRFVAASGRSPLSLCAARSASAPVAFRLTCLLLVGCLASRAEMADAWEEIRRLAADFQRAQFAEATQRCLTLPLHCGVQNSPWAATPRPAAANPRPWTPGLPSRCQRSRPLPRSQSLDCGCQYNSRRGETENIPPPFKPQPGAGAASPHDSWGW